MVASPSLVVEFESQNPELRVEGETQWQYLSLVVESERENLKLRVEGETQASPYDIIQRVHLDGLREAASPFTRLSQTFL